MRDRRALRTNEPLMLIGGFFVFYIVKKLQRIKIEIERIIFGLGRINLELERIIFEIERISSLKEFIRYIRANKISLGRIFICLKIVYFKIERITLRLERITTFF